MTVKMTKTMAMVAGAPTADDHDKPDDEDKRDDKRDDDADAEDQERSGAEGDDTLVAEGDTTASASQESTVTPTEIDYLNHDDNIQSHDEFAVCMIRATAVHFALRRTTPTLYRHQVTCAHTLTHTHTHTHTHKHI